MRKLLLLLLLLATGLGYSQNLKSDFNEANKLYQKKEFRKALDEYQKISDAGYESAALYYNMGNAYFKTNQLAQSILYYERAQKLAPYDDDIRQNLNIAKQATIDRFEQMPQPLVKTAYLKVLKAFTPGTWALTGSIFLLIFLAGVFLYLFTAKRRPGFALGAFALLLGLLSLFFAYAHYNYSKNNRPAIVTATSSYVKSGPGEKAEDVFILHEGTRAIVTDYYDHWKKIKLPDGKIGWIESGDIIEI